MARARNIKPGFFRNADLVELPMEARLLFIGLWTLADREGRLEDRPKQIKMEIFPADSVDCDALLGQLASTGMVARYEVDGKRYLQVVNFTKHQNPHRDEKTSIVPDQSGYVASIEPAPKKHRASTVQTPGEPDAGTVAIGLNPESGFLNPDSRTLIPDSLTEPACAGIERTPEAVACMAMKAAGMASVNPANPKLTALLKAGITVAELASAAAEAVGKGKPFAYALAAAEGQRRDAATAPIPTAGRRTPAPENFSDRVYVGGKL